MLVMHKGYRQQDFNWLRFGIETLQNCGANVNLEIRIYWVKLSVSRAHQENIIVAYKLLIFDFDGTLANSFPWVVAILDELAEKFQRHSG